MASRLQRVLDHIRSKVEDDDDLPVNLIEKSRKGFKFQNWAKVESCQPDRLFYPRCVQDVVDIVKLAADRKKKVKAFGAGHSPSDIACTDGYMLSLDQMNRVLFLDAETGVVQVEAGARLHEINTLMSKHGLAFPSLGSIAEQSIAGAISTGTHGTGMSHGIVARRIMEVEFVNGVGDVMVCSRDHQQDLFLSVCCGLGCIGIITKITIKMDKSFHLRAKEVPAQMTDLLADIPTLAESAEYVRFHWYPHTDKALVWKAERVAPADEEGKKEAGGGGGVMSTLVGFHGLEFLYYCARMLPSVIPSLNKAYHSFNTKQVSNVVTGPSHEVFKLNCLFKQYVNEWAIPIENCVKALQGLRQMIDVHNFKVHFPIEVRFVDKDDLWLSPCYGRRTVYIGIIMYRPYGAPVPYRRYFEAFEHLMKSLDGRPHWAKHFDMSRSDLARVYPRLDDFDKVRRRMDPTGVFENDRIKRIFDLN